MTEAIETELIHPDDAFYNSAQSGKFIKQEEDFYLFDFGQEKFAAIETWEFSDSPEKNETLSFLVERPLGAYWAASHQKLEKLKLWDYLEGLAKSGQVIEGQILSKNKGGLSVDIGLRAFLPMSQIDIHRVEDPDSFIGKKSQFRVTSFDHDRGNIVISRRALLEEERAERHAELLEGLAVGKKYEGIVRNLTKYGAFVDIGGVEGLLHMSNMSWGRIDHPSEIMKPGDSIRVILLELDKKKMRLSLGRKQLLEDPWEKIVQKINVGDEYEGPIVSLAPFGAFVEIEEGLEGLVHISEIAWLAKFPHAKDAGLKVGEKVKVKVLGVDTEDRRISLSIKQLLQNPYEKLKEEYPMGTKIEGKISNITEFGIFIEIAPNIDGLVHQSDVSWTNSGKNFGENFKVGEMQEVRVLDIDIEAGRISLGIKQLSDDPWATVQELAKVGQKIDVTIMRIADFGAFAEVMPGIEGLIHVSELSEERVESPASVVKVGQVVNVLVTGFDRANERIGLSLKRDELEVDVVTSFDEMEGSASTLGDVLRDRLGIKED